MFIRGWWWRGGGVGVGVDTKIVNPWPGGSVNFFKFIANFQISIGYGILQTALVSSVSHTLQD